MAERRYFFACFVIHARMASIPTFLAASHSASVMRMPRSFMTSPVGDLGLRPWPRSDGGRVIARSDNRSCESRRMSGDSSVSATQDAEVFLHERVKSGLV